MDEHNEMVMDILRESSSNFCKDVYNMIVQGNIDGELDLKLRTLETAEPYNIIIPLFRQNLGLTITNDEDCVKELEDLKIFVSDSEYDILHKIISFIQGEDLDNTIYPEMELMSMMEHIPVEKYPAVYNCIDYISEISNFSSDEG